MAQFHHEHVLQLVGVVTVGLPALLVVEYCQKGSLRAYLAQTQGQLLHANRLQLAQDCVDGLEYLARLVTLNNSLSWSSYLLILIVPHVQVIHAQLQSPALRMFRMVCLANSINARLNVHDHPSPFYDLLQAQVCAQGYCGPKHPCGSPKLCQGRLVPQLIVRRRP